MQTDDVRTDDESSDPGFSRRRLIQRSAMVGGTVVWVAPAIESLTSAPASPEPADAPQESADITP